MKTALQDMQPAPGEPGEAARVIRTVWHFARPEQIRVQGRKAWRHGLDCEYGGQLEPPASPTSWRLWNR